MRAGKVLVAIAVVLPLPSAAQIATSHGTPTIPATTQLTFGGQLESAITIEVTGSIDLSGNETTVVSGSGSAGVINFGTYDLAGNLLTGAKHRVNGPPSGRGTYLVATLSVRVLFSGGFTSANVDIARTNPTGGPPDIPQNHLFFAFMGPKNAKAKNQKLTWPRWKDFPEQRLNTSVFEVPAAGYVPGTGNLDAQMASGDFLDHQIAVWIPDAQPAGPFSTTVTYTATAN